MTQTGVHAFFGFKGGAGRSMILAHIASMLAVNNQSVLIIDSDLEAPGLGDFFDQFNTDGADSARTSAIENWRAREGMVDLLNDLYQASLNNDLQREGKKSVAGRMKAMIGTTFTRPATGIIRFPQRAGTDFWLLGPGDHRAEPGLGASRYVERLLRFDWFSFMRGDGARILTEMGTYLREGDHGFDHILVDARTGYSVNSLQFLRYFANTVVGVTSWNTQAIDGMARTLPIVTQPVETGSGAIRDITGILAMNKGPDFVENEAADKRIKSELIRSYFGLSETMEPGSDLAPHFLEFPFLDDIQFREGLIWNMHRMAEATRQSRKTPTEGTWPKNPEPVSAFVKSLKKLYRHLTDDDFDQASIEKLHDRYSLRGRTSTQFNRPFDRPFAVSSLRGTQSDGEIDPVSDYDPEDSSSFSQTSAPDDLDNLIKNILREFRDAGANSERQKDLSTRFRELDKDARKLVRARLLRQLHRETRADVWRDLVIRLDDAFDLRLDPSTLVEIVAEARHKESATPDRRGQQDDTDNASRLEAWAFVRAFVLDLAEGETETKEKELRELLDSGEVADSDRAAADYLLRYRTLKTMSATVPEPEEVLRAVERLTTALAIPFGAGRPQAREQFGQWNLLDTLETLATALGSVVLNIRQDDFILKRLLLAISNLEETIEPLLSVRANWEDQPDHEFARQREQWATYVIQLFTLRRLRFTAEEPHRHAAQPRGVLSDEELAEWLRVANLPAPDSAQGWDWSRDDRFDADVEDRIAAEARVISLQFAVFSPLARDDIQAGAIALLRTILGHQMARFTGRSDGKTALIRNEAANWLSLLSTLSNLLDRRQNAAVLLRLHQRICRITGQSVLSFSDVSKANNAAGLMISGLTLGALAPEETLDEFAEHLDHFKTTESTLTTGYAGMSEHLDRSLWLTANAVTAGRFVEARSAYSSIVGAIESGAPIGTQDLTIVPNLVAYAIRNEAMLGEWRRAEALDNLWWARLRYSVDGLDDNSRMLALLAIDVAQSHLTRGAEGRDGLTTWLERARTMADLCPIQFAQSIRAQTHLLAVIGGLEEDLRDPADLLEDQKMGFATVQWRAGVQRPPGDAAAAWTGGGVFTGDRINLQMTSFVGTAYGQLIHALVLMDRRDEAARYLKHWWPFVERDRATPCWDSYPIAHYHHALFHAFSYALADRSSINLAFYSRDKEIEVNGRGRCAFYDAIFDLCGLPVQMP